MKKKNFVSTVTGNVRGVPLEVATITDRQTVNYADEYVGFYRHSFLSLLNSKQQSLFSPFLYGTIPHCSFVPSLRRRQSIPRSRHTAEPMRRKDSDHDVMAWSMRRLSASNALTHGQPAPATPQKPPQSPNSPQSWFHNRWWLMEAQRMQRSKRRVVMTLYFLTLYIEMLLHWGCAFKLMLLSLPNVS